MLRDMKDCGTDYVAGSYIPSFQALNVMCSFLFLINTINEQHLMNDDSMPIAVAAYVRHLMPYIYLHIIFMFADRTEGDHLVIESMTTLIAFPPVPFPITPVINSLSHACHLLLDSPIVQLFLG